MYKKGEKILALVVTITLALIVFLFPVGGINFIFTQYNQTFGAVNVTDAFELYAYEVNLQYLSSIINIQQMNFLGPTTQATYGTATRDNTLSVYGSKLNASDNGTTGSGVLFNVTFNGPVSITYTRAIQRNGTEFDLYFNGSLINTCQILSTPDMTYTLMENITTGGTCIVVMANNVTLDLNGNYINGGSLVGTYGVLVNGFNDTKIINGTLNGFDYGIYINSSASSMFSGGTIQNSIKSAIYLASGSDNVVLSNLAILDTNASGYDLQLDNSGVNGTVIENITIGNYSLGQAGGTLTVRNDFGEIKFSEPVNGSGVNFSRDIYVSESFAEVRSDINRGLNKSANITWYNNPYVGETNLEIFRDGEPCPSSVCTNYTSLNASTVIFSVTGWTNYSVSKSSNLSDCGILPKEDTVYTVMKNISAKGDCFTITGNNITLDMMGYYVNCENIESWRGVLVAGANRTTIKNGHFENCFAAGVESINAGNTSIRNVTIAAFDFYLNVTIKGISLVNGGNHTIHSVGIDGVSGRSSFFGVIIENSSYNKVLYVNQSHNGGGSYGSGYGSGDRMSFGLYVSGGTNNTVANCNFDTMQGDTAFKGGMYVAGENSTFSNLTFVYNDVRAVLIRGANNTFQNINASYNDVGFEIVSGSGNTIQNSYVIASQQDGFYLDMANNNLLRNISSRGNIDFGIRMVNSSGNRIVDVNLISNSKAGFNFSNSFDNEVSNFYLNGTSTNAIRLENALRNLFANGSINQTFQNTLFVLGGSHNTTFRNISIARNPLFGSALNIASRVDGSQFIDVVHIPSYAIAGGGGKLSVKKTGVGEINFADDVNGSGSNFTGDIFIANNFTHVNSGQKGLDKQANITLYGLTAGLPNRAILRDGVNCGNGCENYTALNASTVIFHVMDWSNYSIGESATLSECGTLSRANSVYTMGANILAGSADPCIAINANNITLEMDGKNITGPGSSGSVTLIAVNANGTKIQNGFLYDFGRVGIEMQDVWNATINNMTMAHMANAANDIFGLRVADGGYHLINNSNLSNFNSGESVYGAYFAVSSHNLISGSSFNKAGSVPGMAAYGIYIDGGQNNSVIDSTASGSQALPGGAVMGVYLGSSNSTIRNVTANSNLPISGWGSGFGIYVAGSNIAITDATTNSEDIGIYVFSSFNVSLVGTNSSYNNNNSYLIQQTNQSTFTSLMGYRLSSPAGTFIYLDNSNGNQIISASASQTDNWYAIRFASSKNNRVINSSFGGNNLLTGFSLLGSSHNNTFINDSFRVASGGNNLELLHNINDTQLIDMPHIKNYRLNGTLAVSKTGIGEIKFLKSVNGSGTNLTRDVYISSNFAEVNSSQTGLNKSANITLIENASVGAHPIILRNGVACPPSICYNFTSLSSEVVIFNVTAWTNYSIGEGNTAPTSNVFLYSSDGSNKTLADLNCFGVLDDPESDKMNVTVKWEFLGYEGFGQFMVDYNNSYPDGSFFSAVLEDGNTTKGDRWGCSIRIFDGVTYSGWISSNSLLILNTAPNVTFIDQLPDWSSTTNRRPFLNWSVYDADGDEINVEFIMEADHLGGPGLCTDDRHYWVNPTNYTLAYDLKCLYDNGYVYNWSLIPHDDDDVGLQTPNRYFNFTAVVDISFTTSTIDFGSLPMFGANDTTDDSPPPFVLKNNGNAKVDVNISATNLWKTFANPNNYYKFKIDNYSGYEGMFNWSGSTTTFTNIPSSFTSAIKTLYYNESGAEIDISVEVPPNEPPGARNSTLTALAGLGE